MNIYLVGYMGSGKTTVGKKLARSLKYEFVDLDHYIEQKSGKKISEILEKEEDSLFRKLEYIALINTTTKKQAVIATGGGTPCYGSNMELINKNGVSVYLKMEPGSLYNRLVHAKDERPLLAGKSEEEMRSFIKDHLGVRQPYYNQANITIDAHNLDPHRIMELAMNLKNNYLR